MTTDLAPRRGMMRIHALAAISAARTPVRYVLLSIPGTELYDERRGCPTCGTAHSIQACPAIRALLFEERGN